MVERRDPLRQGVSRTTTAGGVAALVSPTPAPSSAIEQHQRAAPASRYGSQLDLGSRSKKRAHPAMQHATCDSAVSGVNSMRAFVVTALLAAAEHPPPHPAFAWRGGRATVPCSKVQARTQRQASSHSRGGILRFPPPASKHMPAPAPAPPAPLFLVRFAGGRLLGWVCVGRRVGRYHRRGYDQSSQ